MNKVRLTAVTVALAAGVSFVSGHFGVEAKSERCFAKDRSGAQLIADCTSLLKHDDIPDQLRASALFRRALLLAQQDPGLAEADYRAILEIRPEWTAPLNNLGQIYLNRDELDKALALFNRILEIDPASSFGRGNRALTYYEMERYSEALEDTKVALAADPTDLIDQHLQARILGKLEDYDAALEAFSKTILLDADYSVARRERAWLYFRHLEQPYHAEVDARHLLARNPNDHVASAILGAVLQKLDRYVDAAEAFEHALAIKPEYGYARRALERVERKIAEEKEQNERLSSPAAREIAGPSFGGLLAHSFANLGETARALAELDAVLAQQPNSVFPHTEKARIYFDLGNDEAAIASIADFFNAVSAQEDDAEGWGEMIDRQHTLLGFSYHRLGNAKAARAAWLRGLESERAQEISLWQLRLQSAGHYAGLPDGEISDDLLEGLASCASDPKCLNSAF